MKKCIKNILFGTVVATHCFIIAKLSDWTNTVLEYCMALIGVTLVCIVVAILILRYLNE